MRQVGARILVVDDDPIIVDPMGEFLRIEGYEAAFARSFPDAVRAMDRTPADLILCDANMPGGSGFELLHVARRRWPQTVLIMVTAYGTIESAVEAIRLGAYDYLTKPIVDDELRICLQRGLAQQTLLRENQTLKTTLQSRFGLDAFIGHDHRMLKIFDVIESVAPSKVNVLIQGASGTGKSLLARVIHLLSDRASKPFIEVSCGALPESLLESELFGHARGAFTGAVANKAGKFKAADGGTLFLDEISAASPALQLKLLRVLQTRQFEPVGSNKTETVDTRVLLATNQDLEAEVKAGRFREDLFYRINVVTIDMPTLWERIGDIPLLAKHFLKAACADMGREGIEFEGEALRALQCYRWPGNVRELENVVQRAVVLAKGRRISASELPAKLLDAIESQPAPTLYTPMTLREALAIPEKRIIEAALRANAGNRQITAEQLGINRTTLYKKMKRYGLTDRDHHQS
ncbi:MAG: sigma-54-dependent Fis family transcriptional regulator [Planctomycetes bacterium]|nr:sigma-54-dependent Fis family transcriptional regulator [Planctomycetota bacterium]MBI3833278.1 sigma-54-dependent Fis family transcriptional regulator [Planctomycetota bacterium]